MQILKSDLDNAAKNSIITEEQAHQLWNYLEGLRAEQAKFQTLHVLYYFGGLLILASMGWLLTNAWDDGYSIMFISSLFGFIYVAAAYHLWHKRDLKIPAGLLITAAVGLAPVFALGLQKALGFYYSYKVYTFETTLEWLKSSWFMMEFATIAAAWIALKHFRVALLALPITLAFWALSMDLTSYSQGSGYLNDAHEIVSCLFGLIVIVVSYFINKKYKTPDYAFWSYLMGASSFWISLSLMNSDSELNKLIYCLLNIGLIFFAVYIRRRIFMIYGTFGVLIYIGHLAWKFFKDSFTFPIVLALLGLVIVYLGNKYQKNKSAIEAQVESLFPSFLTKWRPEERV